MSSLRDSIASQFRTFTTVQRLMMINIIFFLIVRLTHSFSALFLHPVIDDNVIYEYFGVPSDLSMLTFRIWTFISYMFAHWEVSHILWNMVVLFFMGRIFQEYLGGKKLISTYLLGGIAGAILFVIGMNVFPLLRTQSHTPIIGASGSILAIAVATATLLPNYLVYVFLIGEVRLKWIVLVIVLLDMIFLGGGSPGQGDPGQLAHLGGAIYGFFYIKQLKKGRDLSGWISGLFERFNRKPRIYKETAKQKKDDEVFIANKKAKQQKMDDILDKISKSGYGSLTQAEKDFLFEMSKEN